jgi:hypothetical protein
MMNIISAQDDRHTVIGIYVYSERSAAFAAKSTKYERKPPRWKLIRVEKKLDHRVQGGVRYPYSKGRSCV